VTAPSEPRLERIAHTVVLALGYRLRVDLGAVL
jgi:hypothetical protein